MANTSITSNICEDRAIVNVPSLPISKKDIAKEIDLNCNEVNDIIDISNSAEADKAATTYNNRGVLTTELKDNVANNKSSPIKILHNKLKDKAVERNIHPQLVLNEAFNALGPGAPSSLRVAYQSLECYTKQAPTSPNRFTQLAHKNDTAAGSKVLCLSRPSLAIERSVRMAPAGYQLPPLHKILSHISSQATLVCKEAPVAPSIIVLGECGPHIQDNDPAMARYERHYLEHPDITKACEMMSCFVLKDIAKHVKVSALMLVKPIGGTKRPGFLIEWKNWKICFIHLPNALIKDQSLVNSYLNGLTGTTYDRCHIIAGDFNYNPKKIMESRGNNLASCYPKVTAKQSISFTDSQLSQAIGTNSANSEIFDGFLTVGANMYAELENYIGKDGKVEQELMPKIVPLGLIPRILLDNTTLRGQTYTDHQGFAFDIIVPHKTMDEKAEADLVNRIAVYQQLTEQISK